MTNGFRAERETTSEARIAARAMEMLRKMIREGRKDQIDYADIRDAVRAQVRKELVLARIEEAKLCKRPDRIKILQGIIEESD